MDKLSMALRSRTVWSVVALALINGVTSVSAQIPADWLPMLNWILPALAAYFRVHPKA